MGIREKRNDASVVSLTLLYISRMLKKVLRVTLNEVKGLMYLKIPLKNPLFPKIRDIKND